MNTHLLLVAILPFTAHIQAAEDKPDDKINEPAPAKEGKGPAKPDVVELEKNEKEAKPLPLDKEDEVKEPKPAPVGVASVNEETREPTVVFGEETTSPTPSPSASVNTLTPTEDLLLSFTNVPSEDLPLTDLSTLEPTTIMVPFDNTEVLAITSDSHDNATHSLKASNAFSHELVGLDEVETYVQNHHNLQYGLIATCITLVLMIAGILSSIRKQVKRRRRDEELPTTASNVL